MKQITIYDLLPLLKNGWVAMDRDETWKWFSHKPHKIKPFVYCEETYWECYYPECESSFLKHFNIAPFDGDWKDSLIKVEHKADQFPQLVKKVERLEKRLMEANEVIKFYSDAHQLTEEEKRMTGEKYHLVYGLKANDYLEKWGVK